jgi:hypothetical protein
MAFRSDMKRVHERPVVHPPIEWMMYRTRMHPEGGLELGELALLESHRGASPMIQRFELRARRRNLENTASIQRDVHARNFGEIRDGLRVEIAGGQGEIAQGGGQSRQAWGEHSRGRARRGAGLAIVNRSDPLSTLGGGERGAQSCNTAPDHDHVRRPAHHARRQGRILAAIAPVGETLAHACVWSHRSSPVKPAVDAGRIDA